MRFQYHGSKFFYGAAVALSLLASGCGGGAGSSAPPLLVTVVSRDMALDDSFQGIVMSGTLCPTQVCTVEVDANQPISDSAGVNIAVSGGTPPYSYEWTRAAGTRAAIDNAMIANPKFSATVNWSDDFTENWQVKVTDSKNERISRSVNVRFTVPAQDNVPAETFAIAVKGSVTQYTVPTASIEGVSSYPTQVYVPLDYSQTSDQLPVIYLADGVPAGLYNGFRFTEVCRILEQLNIRAIVVGVTGQNRDTDYPMPGATAFYQYLTTELMPFVEPKYRINTAQRTLAGHSAAGLFVGLAFTMDRPGNHYFANFIAMDAAFWYKSDLTESMENDLFTAYNGQLPGTKLVLSSSTGGLSDVVQGFYDHLSSLGFTGLNMTLIPPYETQHMLMYDEAFAASLGLIFP